ncbi:hypothetical protein KKG66_07165, partial [bacterium]|nr:hypothetical protein [bacterium]
MQLKFLFGLMIGLGLLLGCDNDTPSTDETCPPQWLNSITMYVPEDTLWIPPGDSASTNLAVIVADGNGDVLEGVRVNLSLSNPQLGFVEFIDPDLRDTTNAQGRVEMRYTAVGLSGEVVFSATAGNVGARDTIVCIAIGTVSVGAINITIEADTLLFTQHVSASAS